MENLTYIESYFQQTLNEDEKKNFEKRCEEETAFAEEVAFYISARETLREELLQQKKEQWKTLLPTEKELPSILPIKKLYQRKWFMYAAASVLLVFAVYIFEKPQSAQQLATNYVQTNYTHISLIMGSEQDSIQMGLTAHNNKDYNKALLIFEAFAKSHPDNADAKKYSGLGYLLQENYDKALLEFSELANMKSLFTNPGIFLQAVTLLERNNTGDKEKAKQLLQQVKDQHLEGHEKAEEWLKRF